ncbi:hypothetical protein, partial [Actinacidiphila glaucinigra]
MKAAARTPTDLPVFFASARTSDSRVSPWPGCEGTRVKLKCLVKLDIFAEVDVGGFVRKQWRSSTATGGPALAHCHGSCSSGVCAGQRLAGPGVDMGTATVIMNVC